MSSSMMYFFHFNFLESSETNVCATWLGWRCLNIKPHCILSLARQTVTLICLPLEKQSQDKWNILVKVSVHLQKQEFQATACCSELNRDDNGKTNVIRISTRTYLSMTILLQASPEITKPTEFYLLSTHIHKPLK